MHGAPPRTRRRTLSTTSPILTSSTSPGADTPRPLWLGLSTLAWVQIGLVTLLMVALYWPNLQRLWLKTNLINGAESDNWSHSTLVPLIGLTYLYLRRHELWSVIPRPLLPTGGTVGDVRARLWGGGTLLVGGLVGAVLLRVPAVVDVVGSVPAGYFAPLAAATAFYGLLVLALDWGIGSLLAGMLLFGYGIWPGQNDYLKDVGMVVTLFGAVLTLGGWPVMRIAWFPVLFLIFAIPWPGLVYSKIALPLQMLAAKVAVIVLNIAQVDSVVEGSRIVISPADSSPRILNVAEACAGMRSLMTFLTLAAAMAFLQVSRPTWQKLILVASAVPIAVLCNVARVSVQGLLDVYVSTEFSAGFAHVFVGLVMLIPAFFLLLLVSWALDQVFLDDEDDEPQGVSAAAGGGVA